MSSTHVPHESRRSTRVRLKVVIEAKGVTEPLTCDGETIVVNLHGALISIAVRPKRLHPGGRERSPGMMSVMGILQQLPLAVCQFA